MDIRHELFKRFVWLLAFTVAFVVTMNVVPFVIHFN